MILNSILILIIILSIIFLIKLIKRNDLDKYFLPICSFIISEPEYIIDNNIKIVKFSISTSNDNRYFRDFPLGFKFFSTKKFSSRIKISYTEKNENEVEIIYDRIIEFDDNAKEYIHYINDIIVGVINIEIYTFSQCKSPSILFEILQSNICHMETPHKLEIIFPKK